MLNGKKLLLGITGSIATYKSAYLVRLLRKNGAEVKVVATPSALDFISPLTLSTLSGNPVLCSFTKKETGEWHNHIELALWANLVIIAPATANIIGQMANGHCSNLLLAVYLSARCPTFLAPAMDLDMLRHPATQHNIDLLKRRGNKIIESGFGELASGLIGEGRMAEPEEILNVIVEFFKNKNKLKGNHALVTAGPTYEALDPVRYFGNLSSGKMGFAIAEELAFHGATVELVTGPTQLITTQSGIKVHNVTSADEMMDCCEKLFLNSDITVLSAAVSDYRPIKIESRKIKKQKDKLVIELVKTPDIAQTLGKKKKHNQIMVGFALETENEKENAQKKLKDKNLDLIVLNSLNDSGAGFGYDTNKVSILNRKDEFKEYSLKSKKEVATDIINAIIEIKK